ncbi:MAG: MATE family efflux transporter [Candidatus Omnitrophica bacterium]|nr:MATE family efflux transporter [Candidatus Omnitrophota bacterium]
MILNLLLKEKKLVRESWSVSWPMMLIMFFIFLIGFTDVYVAGKFGKEIQAAYGFASQIYFVFSIIAFALTVGTVSVVSRLFTSEKKEEFNIAVDSSLIVSLFCGVIFSLIGLAFSKPIIYGVNVPAVLKTNALPLMRIYSVGLLFSYLLLNTNGILRACKSIKRSLVTMFVVCLLNVGLNFLLAFRTPLGFQGIAVATVISTFSGCIINLIFVKSLTSGRYRFSAATVKKIFNIGWPAGLLQVLWQLASVVLFLVLSALPRHNIEVMAAFTNGLKVESAIFLPAFAFNMAAAVIVGNLLGKKKSEESFHAGIVTAVTGVIIVTFLSILVVLNSPAIAAFLSPNDIVVNESVKYICISLIFEPVMAWGVILAGSLNGAGDTKSVMKIITLSIWLVRIPLSYLLGIHFGLGAVSVWWSMNLSILAQTFFITRHYFSRKWIARAESLLTLPDSNP